MAKKVNLVFLLLLLAWFTIFITGLSIGDAVLAEKDFDVVTIVWWVLYIGCVVLFLAKPKIGQYVCTVFQFLWIIMQSLNFFASPSGIAHYNDLFKDTHHIMAPSDTFLIPDTAHLILLTLLLLSFAAMIVFIVTSWKSKTK